MLIDFSMTREGLHFLLFTIPGHCQVQLDIILPIIPPDLMVKHTAAIPERSHLDFQLPALIVQGHLHPCQTHRWDQPFRLQDRGLLTLIPMP